MQYMTPALPHPINDRSPGLKKMVRKWMLSHVMKLRAYGICVPSGRTVEWSVRATHAGIFVIQVEVCESRKPWERRGVVRRGVPNRRLSVRS
jgi:hypothetical protein